MQFVDKTQELLVENIKASMEALGMSVADLADACGLSRQAIYNIIKAERFPGPDNIDRISRALHKEIWELFADKKAQKKVSPHEALRIIQQHLDNEKHQIFREKHKKNEIQNPALSELVVLLSSLDDEEVTTRLDELKAFLRVRDEALVEDEIDKPIVKRRKL